MLKSLSSSVTEGFGVTFDEGQKHIPIESEASCSIITIKVDPKAISIVKDQYKLGRIKLTFSDQTGHQFNYLPITDRGFYDYAIAQKDDFELNSINSFFWNQEEIFLRIGLGRSYQQLGKPNSYWLQVNGIYSFPNYLEHIRNY